MTKPHEHTAVRPLSVSQHARSRISRATLVMLLLTGGLAGYFFGLPTTEMSQSPVAAPPTTAATLTAAGGPVPTPAHYDWLKQNPTDSVQQAWGIFAAVELDDTLFLLVFANIDVPEKRVLWRSTNGKDWTEIPLELGDAIVDDVDVYEDTLLLSGWLDGAPAVWRSQPSPTTNPAWSLTRLDAPDRSLGDIRFLDSSVNTEVNSAGEITVAVRTQSDITPLLLDFAADPLATSVLQLERQPVVAVSGQRIWAQVVSNGGMESVHTVELPTTTVLEPASGPYAIDVGLVTSGTLWASSDGSDFESVDVSELPRPAIPHALGDSFATAIEDRSGTHRLWISPDGVDWEQSDALPPAECGGWDHLVIGGPGLLVIDSTFETTCVSTDGVEWEVRHSPYTTVDPPGQFWTDGTETGYIALARGSSDLSVLMSADGHDWRPIEFASGLLGTHAFLVNDRLVTNAMTYGPPPLGRHFSVWVGNPSAS